MLRKLVKEGVGVDDAIASPMKVSNRRCMVKGEINKAR
jgi:hypothetical protein